MKHDIEKDMIRILIVDDEVKYLNSLSDRLRLKGFEVTSVDNGESAIQIARDKVFDVAVVDLQMPGMNGQELLLKLKKEQKFLQVLILTGYGNLSKAMECMNIGAVTFLEKSYSIEDVAEAIKEAYVSKLISTYKHKIDSVKSKDSDYK